MNHGNWFAKPNAELAQTELNSLVKDIEFYKIKNGVYPDSLGQIDYDEKSISIHDPFLPTKSSNGNNFTYQRILDRYTLLSVGLDRIPYTNDDIYPTITNGDIDKFGLITRNNIPNYHQINIKR
jgi:hypothetical protein